MKIVKRIALTLLLLAVLAAGLFCYARFIEPGLLTTTRWYTTVPEEVNTGKIVFFSDTHFGKLYAPSNLSRIVEAINAEEPDLVIFGGDFFDNYNRDQAMLDLPALQSQLKNIKAKYGKFAVFGNHDYGGGAVRVYEGLMNGGGFTVLKNANEWIEGLNLRIIGFDDILIGYTDPALYNIRSETFTLIVAHEPDIAGQLSLPAGGMMLAGHSHGGQVWMPYFTQFALPKGATTYVKGNYPQVGVKQNLNLFVSSGIGTAGYPMRFLNVPEIVAVSLNH